MPGERLKQYGKGKSDGNADKGLLRANPPVPEPKEHRRIEADLVVE